MIFISIFFLFLWIYFGTYGWCLLYTLYYIGSLKKTLYRTEDTFQTCWGRWFDHMMSMFFVDPNNPCSCRHYNIRTSTPGSCCCRRRHADVVVMWWHRHAVAVDGRRRIYESEEKLKSSVVQIHILSVSFDVGVSVCYLI